MNDLAYDISYLIELESAQAEAPPPPRVARPAAPPAPPGAAATQAAMARELLQAAEAHEEWIRQYLGAQGSVQCAA